MLSTKTNEQKRAGIPTLCIYFLNHLKTMYLVL
jgi:hypothetical protein